MIALVVLTFIDLFVPFFYGVLLLRVVLSYLMKPRNRLLEALINLTEPLLGPIRKVFPPAGGVDFAPLVTLLVLQGLQLLADNFIHP
jgi:YggT family protein